MPAHGDINFRPGSGRTPGNTSEMVFISGGVNGASPNATFNITSKLMSVDGNVRVANSGNLYFGGSQANTVANSHFAVQYNVSATSLDFIFLGA